MVAAVMLSQSLARAGPVVSDRPSCATASASSERPTRCSPSARLVHALVRSYPTGEIAMASRSRASPSSISPSMISEQPMALSASARGPSAPACSAASSAARANGSTSLKRPCSIAILACRARIRARSGLLSSSGSRSTARATAARASSARPSDHWARESSSSMPAARRGRLSSSTSPTAWRSSASARPYAPSLIRAWPALRTSSIRSQPVCPCASGTRDHRSSARSSRAPASPWAWTRSAASAARTDATSASRWQPAER